MNYLQSVFRAFSLLCLLSFLPFPLYAADKIPALDARLLVDQESIAPGQKFRAGVHFKIPEHWHIYWKYPGDAGLAPRITLKSEGIAEVSPLYWPVPIEFSQGPDLKGYGYENEALLFADVTAGQVTGETLKLGAKLFVLKCSATLCVPERLKLSTTIQVGKSKQSGDFAEFEKWARQVPLKDPNEALSHVEINAQPSSLEILAEWKEPIQSTRSFVSHDSAFSIVPEIKRESVKVRYVFQISLAADQKLKQKTVDVVLVADQGMDTARAVEVSLPASDLK